MGQIASQSPAELAANHPEMIKARIRVLHGSVAAFEAARGLPPRSVRDVLRGRASRRTAEAVARLLGVSTQELFPGRFAIKTDDISHKGETHRLNEGAR